MTKTGLLALAILAAWQMGCASYEDVAKVNKDNLAALGKMETQLDAQAADRIYQVAKIDSGTMSLALSRAAATQSELERTFGVDDCREDKRCLPVLNHRLAMIELDYWASRDEGQEKTADLRKLHLEFSKAFKALKKNGEEIQEYLELNWFQRRFEDAKGMDTEQLQKIGEDIKAITTRLAGSER